MLHFGRKPDYTFDDDDEYDLDLPLRPVDHEGPQRAHKPTAGTQKPFSYPSHRRLQNGLIETVTTLSQLRRNAALADD